MPRAPTNHTNAGGIAIDVVLQEWPMHADYQTQNEQQTFMFVEVIGL